MTPEQERAKLEAEKPSREEYLAQKFESPKCFACNGRGYGLAGRFPTLLTCRVCGGSGHYAN